VILVTVGLEDRPFDRLLEAVAVAVRDEPLYVQHGPSSIRVSGAICSDSWPYGDLERLACDARTIVSHAGVGSIALALRAGKKPIVMPRESRRGEHVDDHQGRFAGRLDGLGLVHVVHDASSLQEALRTTAEELSWRASSGQTPLAAELRDLVKKEIADIAGGHEEKRR
jgi:UDP-N-acetylglucosamine transferase subunit ALG13